MGLTAIDGGFQIKPADKQLLNQQRAITKAINDRFIQVGAAFLAQAGKAPFDDDWFKKERGATNLQGWIDEEKFRNHNVGFNLQFGWMDIDIDASDPEYNKCILAGLQFVGIDTRFRFGRKSVGVATHVLVQLGEEEAKNWEGLHKFEPAEFKLKGQRYHCQLRSYATALSATNLPKSAKQTVVPGSVYSHKTEDNQYDISVWYDIDGGIAPEIGRIATTTPRRASFNDVVRGIAFGTMLYLVGDHWSAGQRHIVATRVSGWLARVVADSQAMNNHEAIAKDVYCPIDDDSIAENLLKFIATEKQDEELHMRVRAYRDAREKLARNPDAKIPGWPAMEHLIGAEGVWALRAVFMPGSDVSELTKLSERYVYDETDNRYIDRERFAVSAGVFVHTGEELERRHRDSTVRVGGKPREAFKVLESSSMRKRVSYRDMYPNLQPGAIYRIGSMGEVLPDEDTTPAVISYNTWRGWPIAPAAKVDEGLLKECATHLDQLLAYLTRDNADQIEWIKKWVAWTFQHPGTKQQIAWVCVGGQGVGKSFIGNRFFPALFGSLWGSASPSIVDGGFSVEPFIDKMFVFIDEAKFHSEKGTDEIKKLIRNVNIGGAEKFGHARNYRIFSRVMFASNRFDMNIGQANTQDRALFYTKAYDKDHQNMSEAEFRAWAETLKPWFDMFDEFLNRRDVLEHYMHLFMEMPVAKHEVESIRHSSSGDAQIVNSNMSWARRIAKHIVEEGRVFEDIDISWPFSAADLNVRVTDLAREMGMRNVQGAKVLAEFHDAGVIEKVEVGGRLMLRFTHKHGTLVDMFGKAIGVGLDKLYTFGDGDFGRNDEIPKTPPPYKGGRSLSTKF